MSKKCISYLFKHSYKAGPNTWKIYLPSLASPRVVFRDAAAGAWIPIALGAWIPAAMPSSRRTGTHIFLSQQAQLCCISAPQRLFTECSVQLPLCHLAGCKVNLHVQTPPRNIYSYYVAHLSSWILVDTSIRASSHGRLAELHLQQLRFLLGLQTVMNLVPFLQAKWFMDKSDFLIVQTSRLLFFCGPLWLQSICYLLLLFVG